MIADGNFNNYETQQECRGILERYLPTIIAAHHAAIKEYRQEIAKRFSRIVPSWRERQAGDWHGLICKHLSEMLQAFDDVEVGDSEHSFCTDFQGKIRLFYNQCPPGRAPAKEKVPQLELQFDGEGQEIAVSDGSDLIWLRCFMNADHDTSEIQDIRIEYRENDRGAWSFLVWKKPNADEGSGPAVLPAPNDSSPDEDINFPFEEVKEDTGEERKRIQLL